MKAFSLFLQRAGRPVAFAGRADAQVAICARHAPTDAIADIVAMSGHTRAAHKARLTNAAQRRLWGRKKHDDPRRHIVDDLAGARQAPFRLNARTQRHQPGVGVVYSDRPVAPALPYATRSGA